jgi:hypothetical protein
MLITLSGFGEFSMTVYPGSYPGLQFANTFGVTDADPRSSILTLIADDVILAAGVQAATRPRAGLSPPDRLM